MNNMPYKTFQAAVAVNDALVDLENLGPNLTDFNLEHTAPAPKKQKHLSATIEPCYCGEKDEFQVEIYELDVQDRLTSKFNDVTFHLTKSAAEEAACKVNGVKMKKSKAKTINIECTFCGNRRAARCDKSADGKHSELTKQVQTKETVDMSKKTQKYAGPIEIPSVQAILKRIAKRGEKNPIKVKDFENQYQNRVARRLAAAGLVASEKREGVGLVFFGKPVKA